MGAYGETKEATPSPIDTDNDGLLDALEEALCTEVDDADTDDDGILDGNEDLNANGQVDDGETDPNRQIVKALPFIPLLLLN